MCVCLLCVCVCVCDIEETFLNVEKRSLLLPFQLISGRKLQKSANKDTEV